jgi:hypothetical protein
MMKDGVDELFDSNDFSSMVLSSIENRNINYNQTNQNGLFENGTMYRSYANGSDYGENFTLQQEKKASEYKDNNNYWALLALVLVFGTACGNILVCLAIAWEKRLQNVTNYFLASLAITDLMVAILVMPLGIVTLYMGK